MLLTFWQTDAASAVGLEPGSSRGTARGADELVGAITGPHQTPARGLEGPHAKVGAGAAEADPYRLWFYAQRVSEVFGRDSVGSIGGHGSYSWMIHRNAKLHQQIQGKYPLWAGQVVFWPNSGLVHPIFLS